MTCSARRERRSPTDARSSRSAVRARWLVTAAAAGTGSVWPGRDPARRGEGLLPGGAGEVGGDDGGGVAVHAAAGPVIPHRGTRGRMRCGLLHVPERDAGVERGGDE